MMVGSLEADIKNVCNKPFDNHEVLDDFDDSDSDKDVPIQNMQVNNMRARLNVLCYNFTEIMTI